MLACYQIPPYERKCWGAREIFSFAASDVQNVPYASSPCAPIRAFSLPRQCVSVPASIFLHMAAATNSRGDSHHSASLPHTLSALASPDISTVVYSRLRAPTVQMHCWIPYTCIRGSKTSAGASRRTTVNHIFGRVRSESSAIHDFPCHCHNPGVGSGSVNRKTRSLAHWASLTRQRPGGWGELAEDPGREIVFGAVTQPWVPAPVFRSLALGEFAKFQQPGFVKIVSTWVIRY